MYIHIILILYFFPFALLCCIFTHLQMLISYIMLLNLVSFIMTYLFCVCIYEPKCSYIMIYMNMFIYVYLYPDVDILQIIYGILILCIQTIYGKLKLSMECLYFVHIYYIWNDTYK